MRHVLILVLSASNLTHADDLTRALNRSLQARSRSLEQAQDYAQKVQRQRMDSLPSAVPAGRLVQFGPQQSYSSQQAELQRLRNEQARREFEQSQEMLRLRNEQARREFEQSQEMLRLRNEQARREFEQNEQARRQIAQSQEQQRIRDEIYRRQLLEQQRQPTGGYGYSRPPQTNSFPPQYGFEPRPRTVYSSPDSYRAPGSAYGPVDTLPPPTNRSSFTQTQAPTSKPVPYVPIPRALAEKGWQSPWSEGGRTTAYAGVSIYPNTVAWRVVKDRLEQISKDSPTFRAAALEETAEVHKALLSELSAYWEDTSELKLWTLRLAELDSLRSERERQWKSSGEGFKQKLTAELFPDGNTIPERFDETLTKYLNLKRDQSENELAPLYQSINSFIARAQGVSRRLKEELTTNLNIDSSVSTNRERLQEFIRTSSQALSESRETLKREFANRPQLAIPTIDGLAEPFKKLHQEWAQNRAGFMSEKSQLQQLRAELSALYDGTASWSETELSQLERFLGESFQAGEPCDHVRSPLASQIRNEADRRQQTWQAALKQVDEALSNKSALAQAEDTAWQADLLQSPGDAAQRPDLWAGLHAEVAKTKSEANLARNHETERQTNFPKFAERKEKVLAELRLVIQSLRGSTAFRLETDLKLTQYLAKRLENGQWVRQLEVKDPLDLLSHDGDTLVIAHHFPSLAQRGTSLRLALLNSEGVAKLVELPSEEVIPFRITARNTGGFTVIVKDRASGELIREFTFSIQPNGEVEPGLAVESMPEDAPLVLPK